MNSKPGQVTLHDGTVVDLPVTLEPQFRTIHISVNNIKAAVEEFLQRWGELGAFEEEDYVHLNPHIIEFGELITEKGGNEICPIKIRYFEKPKGGAPSKTNGQAKTKL